MSVRLSFPWKSIVRGNVHLLNQIMPSLVLTQVGVRGAEKAWLLHQAQIQVLSLDALLWRHEIQLDWGKPQVGGGRNVSFGWTPFGVFAHEENKLHEPEKPDIGQEINFHRASCGNGGACQDD